jgi:serine protease Do
MTIRPLTADVAASMGLQDVRGALVNSVGNGSPAERAGLKSGDVITAFNGAPVTDMNSLRNAVAGSQPGTEVTLTIIRECQPQELRATLGELNTNGR